MRDLLGAVAGFHLGEVRRSLVALGAYLFQAVLEIDLFERGKLLALGDRRTFIDGELSDASGDLEAEVDLPHLDVALENKRTLGGRATHPPPSARHSRRDPARAL